MIWRQVSELFAGAMAKMRGSTGTADAPPPPPHADEGVQLDSEGTRPRRKRPNEQDGDTVVVEAARTRTQRIRRGEAPNLANSPSTSGGSSGCVSPLKQAGQAAAEGATAGAPPPATDGADVPVDMVVCSEGSAPAPAPTLGVYGLSLSHGAPIPSSYGVCYQCLAFS